MKFLSLFLTLNFGLLTLNCDAQNRNIDSLLTLIDTDKQDTNQVNHLNKLSREYINIGEYDNSLKYGNKALALASSLSVGNRRGWHKGMAIAYNNIGVIYNKKGNYFEALKKHYAALKVREEIGDKNGIANSYNSIGIIYNNQGNYPKALKSYFLTLKIKEEIGDKQGIANTYNNIGNIYNKQGKYPNALLNYFAALKIRKDINDRQGIAMSYNNIGNIYYNQGNYSEALKNYFPSLKICLDIKDKQGISMAYTNIGNIYVDQGNYDEALKIYSASLKISNALNDKQSIVLSYSNIGDIYLSKKNYPMALKNHFAALKMAHEIGDELGIADSYYKLSFVQIKLHKLKEATGYLNEALKRSKKIGSKEIIKVSYSRLASIDSMQGNWKEAYQHYKLFTVYRDSIDNEQTKKKIIESTLTYKFETQEAAIKAEQDKKDVVEAADKKRQQIVLILVSCVLLLVFVFAGLILRSLRVTRKQKVIIEEKNKDIIDSINYAKRIQDALLKEEEHVSKHLPEHFVLFKPKDIVSGDFYWAFEKTLPSSNGEGVGVRYWYLAAVDCTGHGVPGAFMSMLGIAFLNEITATNQLLSPSEILDQLRDRVLKELGQTGKEGQSKDGMDISLMRLNLETKELQWAGANNPLYFIQDGTLTEVKPNKQPIGYHLSMQPFTSHVLKLETGTTFYLFTDGYADQFGGEKGKKFKYSQLKELLLSMQDKPMPEEKKILDDTFENWKAWPNTEGGVRRLEQVDDVCVIGVRI